MKKRILIATLTGAAIAFVWGFVSWSLLPWHKMQPFKDNAEVSRVILENSDGHAMYIAPSHKGDEPDVDAISNGPYIYAIVRPGKLDSTWSMGLPMALSFAVNLFLALVIALIMKRRSHYRSKVLVGLAFGTFAGITAALPLAIWMELPKMETVARLCDPAISWTLAALVMAAIVKKPKRRIFSS